MGSISPEVCFELQYDLPRGGREAVRLAAQHHMLQARQGWTIHPKIATALLDIPHPRIADVATGTGIWACEVAEQMPHAEVIGLDISDQQFSPQWTWPSNAGFGLYDLLEEIPSELVGMFDLVHVRLLLCAGPAVDKRIFIERFQRLLKPGGWLQWDDLTFPNIIACEQKEDGLRMRSMEDHPFIKVESEHLLMEEKAGWFSKFEDHLNKFGGFEETSRTSIPVRPHLLQLETELTLAVFTELADMLVRRKSKIVPGLEAEVHEALASIYSAADRGLQYSYTWGVGTARKI